MDVTAIYQYVPHHRTKAKIAGEVAEPPKTREQLPSETAADRFNSWLAVKVTDGVGTMWCAYVFSLLAFASLPAVLTETFHLHVFPHWLVSVGLIALVAWIAQTFLQLVLLSVIMVGQNIQSAASDKRADATFKDADAVLHEAVKIQEHLVAQDQVLTDLVGRLERLETATAAPPAR
jgi:hypothetical protein